MKRTLTAAGICGIATPIVAFICIFGAIASWQPFSWTNNALSDLGVQAGITAPLFNSGLVTAGLLGMVFSAGLYLFAGKHPLGKAGSVIFGLACVALVCIGVFNEHYNPTHFYVSVAFFVLMPIALLILVPSFWLIRERKLSILTLVLAVAAALPWALQFSIHYVSGVAVPEFASSLAGSLWAVVLSVKMLREANKTL